MTPITALGPLVPDLQLPTYIILAYAKMLHAEIFWGALEKRFGLCYVYLSGIRCYQYLR